MEYEPDKHDDPCQRENHENCHAVPQNIVEKSIVEITQEVILSFPEAQDVKVVNKKSVSFGIDDNIYLMCLPADELTGMPYVVTNRKSTMHPHILPVTLISTEPKIGALCLFESGSIVGLYLDYKDKVKLCVSQLLRLINLSKKEKVEEYQKEFLYYWNQAAYRAKKVGENKKYFSEYNLFLADDSYGTWLQINKYHRSEVRFYSDSIIFNDSEQINNPQLNDKALYLPLINLVDLVPPTDERPWTAAHIVDIVCGLESQKIDSEMYKQLSEFSFSKKNVFIIFRLNNFFFGCVVEFKHSGTAKFTVKIESQIESVIPICIVRADFKFLNSAIGNDNALVNKKVAIVGAGSLGSYISEELLRSGIKNFVIVDDDVFEPANIMRNRLEYRYSGLPKAKCLAYRLESIHPEVVATPLKQEISAANCLDILTKDIDIVVFTIGSTDTQIACNRILKANAYSKTVLYAWLEGDGESSHVAVIRYNRQGCFECLFTDDKGKYCPNEINVSNNIDPMIISNGCGGTRVAYGNSTLLSASKIVLEAIDDCINEVTSSSPNFVISYINGQITRYNLPDSGQCNCCN